MKSEEYSQRVPTAEYVVKSEECSQVNELGYVVKNVAKRISLGM